MNNNCKKIVNEYLIPDLTNIIDKYLDTKWLDKFNIVVWEMNLRFLHRPATFILEEINQSYRWKTPKHLCLFRNFHYWKSHEYLNLMCEIRSLRPEIFTGDRDIKMVMKIIKENKQQRMREDEYQELFDNLYR